LRILKVTEPDDGDVTPGRAEQRGMGALAKGKGGTKVEEVVNLWKGNWGVAKGVNDMDWAVGRKWDLRPE
jgi:hypothetical protein